MTSLEQEEEDKIMVDILLVDDETYVTESLALTIPWQQLGIDQVYQASSAAQALQLLQAKPIQILVTDIKMPEKTGLQLIEQAKDKFPKLKTVLLTGYSDFEYAKQAIKLRAGDYLLKPVEDDAFIATISAQVKQLEQERQHEEEQLQQLYFRKTDYHLLRKGLMQDLLLGKQRASAHLAQLLQQYEIGIELHQQCLLLTVQLAGRFIGMDSQSSELIEYAIGNIAEEIFAEPYSVWHSSSPHDHVAVLISLPSDSSSNLFNKEHIRGLCYTLQEQVASFLNGEISIVASDWFLFPNSCHKYYREALTTLNRLQMNETVVVMLDEINYKPSASSNNALEELYKPPTLINLLEAGQWQGAKDKLQAFFSQHEQGQFTRERLYEAFIAISNALIYASNKMGIDLHSIDAHGVNLLLDRSMLLDARSLHSWSNEILDLISMQYDESDSYHKKHIIKQVQELINNDLGLESSVKTIADKVFLHPVYLSKLYKNETGESLGDYIIRMRMEKAVYMLKSTNKKIYEITTELGYQNPQYFSKIFRKYYGCTPNEYRDQ